jgi:hypothetical protein
MGKLFLVFPLSNGKYGNDFLCRIKVVHPWCTAWKLAARSQRFIWGEFKSVYKFRVLTRPVPRRKTCRWLAQGITDHSWLAPHLPSDSLTHLFARPRALHCRSRPAHWGPGHEGCPQFFGAIVRPIQLPAYPHSHLPNYNARKIRVLLCTRYSIR